MKYLPEPGKPRLGNTPVKINVKKVGADLVQFVVDTSTADVERVNKYLTSLQEADEIYGGGSGGGSMRGGGPPGMRGGPPGMRGETGSRPPRAGSSGGSKGGPPPRAGSSGAGMSGNIGGMGGIGGYGQVAVADPYAFRIEPVYRKLRYEIGCAMKGLRGTDDWRRGDGTGGLYKVWPKSPADADSTKKDADPKVAADKEFLEKAAMSLRDLAAKFKVKTDELQTADFTVEKLPLQKLNDVVKEVAVKAKPGKPAKPEPEVKNPLEEPDPADDLPKAPEKPAAKPKAKPAVEEPADDLPKAPEKPAAKPKAKPAPVEPAEEPEE
jgi:hypothetical protein